MTIERGTAQTVRLCDVEIAGTVTVLIGAQTYAVTVSATCENCYYLTFTVSCEDMDRGNYPVEFQDDGVTFYEGDIYAI